MNKLITVKEAAAKVKDGDTLMVGGFYAIGTPEELVDEIRLQGTKDLTVINNDFGNPNSALGRLVYSGQVKKAILSWCGYLGELPKMVEEKKIDLELNPQGTLIERIRCGGFGLGGVLTPTGLSTYIEEQGYGERVHMNGRDYLYHTPLHANVTIVQAYQADEAGNLIFRRTQRNFNDTMCFAGDIVIATVATPILKKGEIDPDAVMVPGVVVDYLVQEG